MRTKEEIEALQLQGVEISQARAEENRAAKEERLRQEQNVIRQLNELRVTMMYFKDLIFTIQPVLAAGVNVYRTGLEPSKKTITVVFSLCSLKDQFCKATARELVLERFLHLQGENSSKWSITLELYDDEFSSNRGFSKFILEAIRFKIASNSREYPQYIKEVLQISGGSVEVNQF